MQHFGAAQQQLLGRVRLMLARPQHAGMKTETGFWFRGARNTDPRAGVEKDAAGLQQCVPSCGGHCA